MANAAQFSIPAEHIRRFIDRLEAEKVTMHGFILSTGGRIDAEGYWKPFTAEQPHRMFSVSKSMTSLAIGILAGRGRLSLSDKIITYFPELLPADVPGPLARMTIRNMLRMSTCHSTSAFRNAKDDNWTRTFFTVPPSNEPGAVFAYDTSSSQTLAALVTKLTGQSLLVFLEENLFAPIGATGPKHWLTDPVGICQGGSGLVMTLRDLYKTALFCMGNGDGILPADYLKAATAKQIDTPMRVNPEEGYGYGYMFWRTRDGFSMYGMGGQLAICIPEKQLCLCTIADTQMDPYGVQRIYNAFFEELAPYTSAKPEPDEAAEQTLADTLAALALPVVPNRTDCARELSGVYRVEHGTTRWKALKLEPDALSLQDDTGWKRLRFDIGAWAHSLFPGTEEPCVTSGGWIAPDNFKIVCHVIGDTPCGVEMLISFTELSVTAQMRCVHTPITEGFDGVCSALLA